MTQSEFQRIESLLRVCDTNITRCQKVVLRSSALVEQAKKLIEVFQKTLKDREAAALKSVDLSRQAAHASEQLLAAQRNEVLGFNERPSICGFVGYTKAPVDQRARDQDLMRQYP